MKRTITLCKKQVREIKQLKEWLESKNNKISNLEAQIGSLNEKMDELRKENCLLQNRNNVLETNQKNYSI